MKMQWLHCKKPGQMWVKNLMTKSKNGILIMLKQLKLKK